MDLLSLLLYVTAVVLLGLAAWGVRPGRVHLGWLGLAVAVLAFGVLLPLD